MNFGAQLKAGRILAMLEQGQLAHEAGIVVATNVRPVRIATSPLSWLH
jgi:hypothetical protein